MRKISKIEPTVPIFQKRKRVAAYARVSRETERLLHSMSAQVSYYSKLIQNNPEWEYVGVYADSGISGTGINKREEFNRLIEDCEAGKIDIILTKSISRFARNTVDLLETVRHLKSMGIEVRFEKENIHSMSSDGELMLSILASFAQEEIHSLSENSKWGIRKKYENGTIRIRNKRVLGYRYDGENYVIVPEEAEIIHLIFEEYLDGVTLRNILRHLEERGARSCRGYDFSYYHINYIVRNEIYCGDRLLQKSFVEDPIKHNKVKNIGQLPQYYMKDCHEPIIDRETFQQAQLEAERRAAMTNPTYCFTGKIKCGICGNSYTRKKSIRKGKNYVHWICRSKKNVGGTCISVNFGEEELKRICTEVLEMPSFDEEVFAGEVKNIIVQKNGNLEIHFFGGRKEVWEMPPKPMKPPKVYERKRPAHIFDGKVFCGICGRRYGRVISDSKDKHINWRCRAKSHHGVTCDSVNYPDTEIKKIFSHIMGKDKFDEAEFEQQIKGISVLEDGSLEYKFYDGRAKRWQKT